MRPILAILLLTVLDVVVISLAPATLLWMAVSVGLVVLLLWMGLHELNRS